MERTIHEERLSAKTFGVVIFIVDDALQVYVSQELESKPETGKVPGKFGVVSETSDPGEGPYVTMERGIREETRIYDDDLLKVIDHDTYKIWETQFIEGVWATVFVIRCKNSVEFMRFVDENRLPENNHVKNEVKPIGFMSRTEFEALDLRSGVKNIMNKFGDDIFGPKK